MNFTKEDIEDLKFLLLLLLEYTEEKKDFELKNMILEKSEKILKIIS